MKWKVGDFYKLRYHNSKAFGIFRITEIDEKNIQNTCIYDEEYAGVLYKKGRIGRMSILTLSSDNITKVSENEVMVYLI